MSAAEEGLHELRHEVRAGDQVVQAVRRAGLEQQHGDGGQDQDGEGGDHGHAKAMGPDCGGDAGHFVAPIRVVSRRRHESCRPHHPRTVTPTTGHLSSTRQTQSTGN